MRLQKQSITTSWNIKYTQLGCLSLTIRARRVAAYQSLAHFQEIPFLVSEVSRAPSRSLSLSPSRTHTKRQWQTLTTGGSIFLRTLSSGRAWCRAVSGKGVSFSALALHSTGCCRFSSDFVCAFYSSSCSAPSFTPLDEAGLLNVPFSLSVRRVEMGLVGNRLSKRHFSHNFSKPFSTHAYTTFSNLLSVSTHKHKRRTLKHTLFFWAVGKRLMSGK